MHKIKDIYSRFKYCVVDKQSKELFMVLITIVFILIIALDVISDGQSSALQ